MSAAPRSIILLNCVCGWWARVRPSLVDVITRTHVAQGCEGCDHVIVETLEHADLVARYKPTERRTS